MDIVFLDRCNKELVSGDENWIPDSNFDASSFYNVTGSDFSAPFQGRLNNYLSSNGV